MIYEFYGNHSNMDELSKRYLLEEIEEDMRDQGMHEEDIKIQMEMLKYELFD